MTSTSHVLNFHRDFKDFVKFLVDIHSGREKNAVLVVPGCAVIYFLKGIWRGCTCLTASANSSDSVGTQRPGSRALCEQQVRGGGGRSSLHSGGRLVHMGLTGFRVCQGLGRVERALLTCYAHRGRFNKFKAQKTAETC